LSNIYFSLHPVLILVQFLIFSLKFYASQEGKEGWDELGLGLTHILYYTVQFSHPYMTTGKIIALTRWTFVGKVNVSAFNMLSRLVITFLPRSKRLLISWLQSPSAVILEPKK